MKIPFFKNVESKYSMLKQTRIIILLIRKIYQPLKNIITAFSTASFVIEKVQMQRYNNSSFMFKILAGQHQSEDGTDIVFGWADMEG